MKKIKIYSLLALATLIPVGCVSEAPFSSDREDGKNKYGEFRKSAITFDVKDSDGIQVNTRATAVNIDDFKLLFIRNGKEESYVDYGDMPEVMLLEEGSYVVKVSYGIDLEAEWDNPRFEGESAEFEVNPKEITVSIDPIVCYLKNVKVTVSFDPELASVAGDESYIEVKVKNGKGLKFYKNSELQLKNGGGEAGYFRINDETTLVATFYGSIYGSDMEQETKILTDIEGGNHYKMTFSLHSHDNSNYGDSEGKINVDGSVEYENMETNVVVKEELINDDSERPHEDDFDDNQGGDQTGHDDKGPEVIPSSGISLDDWNVNPSTCALTIKSSTGVTGFIVDIVSDSLSPSELAVVGLAAHMDLITGLGTTEDGEIDLSDPLTGLGFPCKDKVLNQKEISFDISNFMPMLAVLGNGDHTFVLTVTDDKGECVKELKIRINN